MKRLLFLALAIAGLAYNAPTAFAAPGVCTCSDQHTIPNTEQSDCCVACANYAINQKKEINRASKWRQQISGGSDTNLACGAVHFCWCADRTNKDSCFIAGSNNSVATTADCHTTCTDPASNYNTIDRWFDSNYIDRTGTDNTNVCGAYCWCNKPSSDTGTTTSCELHRDTPLVISGRSIPINSTGECTAVCQALTSPGGTRHGTLGIFESTYTNRTGRADCANAATGGTGSTGNTPTTRPTTPAPTIRLFNPLAGASTIVDIINRVIKMLMGTVGAGALLMFIYGGIKWMTAGGDDKVVSEAKSILKNSLLGILLLMFAYTIVATFFSLLR